MLLMILFPFSASPIFQPDYFLRDEHTPREQDYYEPEMERYPVSHPKLASTPTRQSDDGCFSMDMSKILQDTTYPNVSLNPSVIERELEK